MAETFFWYDLETTGTHAAQDRAIQFAGVRTDLDLNPVGEPINLYCYPGDDTVPAPEAILVTGISMLEVQKVGLTEVAFAAAILKAFSEPQTCVVGFNSLRFDDEFVRHLFYRNFYDPYAREWQGGNSRWDVIDLFRMAYALRPEGFEWPKDEAGVPTFRLEKLSAANGVSHEDAHDAVSDVLATIDTVKKLRAAQPRLYDFLYQLRRKRAVTDQLYPLGKQPVVHVSSMYPARQSCVAVVLPLCVQPGNDNGVICFDLSRDPSALLEVGPKELNRRLFTPAAELVEDRIPLKTIHINRCPAIAPLSTIRDRADLLGIDLELCAAHQQKLQRSSGVVEKITEAFAANRFAEVEDVDLMLYQGDFFSSSDRDVMRAIHESSPQDLASFSGRFQDPRLPEMLFRFRARNYPSTLDAAELARWQQTREDRFKGWLDPAEKLAEAEALAGENPENSALADLVDYLKSLS